MKMQMQGQGTAPAQKRILELNPKHTLISNLKNKVDTPEMNEWIELRVDGEMIAASSARADETKRWSPMMCVKSASSSEIHTCDQPAYTRFRMVAFASSAARASRNLIAGRGDT